jgi:hypothetical protein
VLYVEDGLRALTGRQLHDRADPKRQTDGAPEAHVGKGVTGGFRIEPNAARAHPQAGKASRTA